MLLDWTTSNVLFELRDARAWTQTQREELFGPAITAELRLHNGSCSKHGPKEVVQAIKFPLLDDYLLGNIRIVDFGQSFSPEGPPAGLGIPLASFLRSSALAVNRLRSPMCGLRHASSLKSRHGDSWFLWCSRVSRFCSGLCASPLAHSPRSG